MYFPFEQPVVLRIDYPEWNEGEFGRSLDDLSMTQYRQQALWKEAPDITSCVSAIRYLIERTTGWILPVVFVGDMAHNLLDRYNNPHPTRLVPLNEAERGDLIFFFRKSISYKVFMITHVGIMMDTDDFAHSTWGPGWVTDSVTDHPERIGRIATCRILHHKTDPRKPS